MAKRRRTRAGRFIRSKGGRRTAAVLAVGAAGTALAVRAARRRRGTDVSVTENVRAFVSSPLQYLGGVVTGTATAAPRTRAGLLGAKVSTFVQRPFRQTGSFLGSIGRTFTGKPSRSKLAIRRRRTFLGRVQNLISFTP